MAAVAVEAVEAVAAVPAVEAGASGATRVAVAAAAAVSAHAQHVSYYPAPGLPWTLPSRAPCPLCGTARTWSSVAVLLTGVLRAGVRVRCVGV